MSRSMLAVSVYNDALRFGRHLTVTLHRTVRIPVGRQLTYPLPPSLGRLPLERLTGIEPDVGLNRADVVCFAIPMREREAFWLAFEAPVWHPHALRVSLGDIDAVSGGSWSDGLGVPVQNYVVVPIQLWLDGVNAGPGRILQFVATSMDTGGTVEERVAPGRPAEGGLRLRAYAPRPGRFPEKAPPPEEPEGPPRPSLAPPRSLGVGAGGGIAQKVRPDPYGLETWDSDGSDEVHVALLDPVRFRELTGRDAGPEVVDAETYARLGLPWFELDDEFEASALPPAANFSELEEPIEPAANGSSENLPVRRIRRRWE